MQDGRIAELASCSGEKNQSEDGHICNLGSIPRPYAIQLLDPTNRIKGRSCFDHQSTKFHHLELSDVVDPWQRRVSIQVLGIGGLRLLDGFRILGGIGRFGTGGTTAAGEGDVPGLESYRWWRFLIVGFRF